MTNMSLFAYSGANIQTNNPGNVLFFLSSSLPFINLPYITNSHSRRTYKFYSGTPVFPFGHGLHYTNFTTSLSSPSQTSYSISTLLSSPSKFPDQTPFLSL